jgi:prepilin-type N-terminal cleavage/methylation domain-containing protein
VNPTDLGEKSGLGRLFPLRNGRFRALPAFTLIESLITLVVLGILFSASFAVGGGQRASPEKEAQSLARWLSGVMTESDRSGRSFTLRCLGTARGFVEIVWQNPIEKKTYTSLYGCVFNRYDSSVADSVYSPQWNSLTPAATIKIQGAEKTGDDRFVIVSQHARVRAGASPPAK